MSDVRVTDVRRTDVEKFTACRSAGIAGSACGRRLRQRRSPIVATVRLRHPVRSSGGHVEGGMDDQEQVARARDVVFVFQRLMFNLKDEGAGEVCPATIYPERFDPPPGATRLVSQTLLNGQFKPTITMAPGEVQRWRLIHAGIDQPINLRLEGHNLSEIAVDGLALGRRNDRDAILLHRGFRCDVLVRVSRKTGTYLLTSASLSGS